MVSHARMVSDAAELKRFLAGKGESPSPNSVPGQAIEVAEQLSEWQRNPKLMPGDMRAPEVIRRITGLSYLARARFHARRNPSFDTLKRLLRQLGQDNPLPTEPLERPDSARNLVFELEVACHFMAKGLKVKTASEPDVVVERDGKWNFACKMVSSGNSKAVGENLNKGWRQVLDAKHACLFPIGNKNVDFLPPWANCSCSGTIRLLSSIDAYNVTVR